MPLTAEERAAISRANGRRSRGPITAEGKAISSRNALDHGACAEVHILPEEDPALAPGRAAEWHEYYKPRSPAAQHLVATCVAATLMFERTQRDHDHTVAKQVLDAAEGWERRRIDAVAQAWDGLEADPAAALDALTATGHGLRHLLCRWGRLEGRLADGPGWEEADCDEALRLLGVRPGVDRLEERPEGYLVRLCHLQCRGDATELVAALLEPACRPAELRDHDPAGFVGTPAVCSACLGRLIEARCAELRQAEEEAAASDEEERGRALNQALMLEDENKARKYFRYHAESRSTFHRGLKELMATLRRDEEEAAKHPVDLSYLTRVPKIEECDRDKVLELGAKPPAVGSDVISRNEPGHAGIPDAAGPRNEPSPPRIAAGSRNEPLRLVAFS